QQFERRLPGAYLPLRHHDPHLAIFGLAECVGADRIAMETPFGFLGHLGLGKQVADRRIGPRKADARRLADKAAAAVTTDEIARPWRPALAQRHFDAG